MMGIFGDILNENWMERDQFETVAEYQTRLIKSRSLAGKAGLLRYDADRGVFPLQVEWNTGANLLKGLPPQLFLKIDRENAKALYNLHQNGLAHPIYVQLAVDNSKELYVKKFELQAFNQYVEVTKPEFIEYDDVSVTFSTVKAGQNDLFIVREKSFEIRGIPLIMVHIPAGEFMMGSENGYDDEKPVHHVKIEQAFYMGKFPVTQAQYQAVMGNNPSHFKGSNNLPVEGIYWNQAKEFCEKLSVLLKKKFRLPSEAEWEYACRAGTNTQYWWGDDIEDFRCWYEGNSGRKTHPVDEKVSDHMNPFGLCDMHGNIWEWCEDDWDSNYKMPRTQKVFENQSSLHVLRGGSWFNEVYLVRSATRGSGDTSPRGGDLGFRLIFPS